MFLYLLKDIYELLFKGCSLSCKRVDHFVINFMHSITNFCDLSFLEVNSLLPYLACKWRYHHSSLDLGWLRSPLWVACFFHSSSSMLSIFIVSSFILLFKCCYCCVCFKLESNSLLPFMSLRNEPSHLDSLLS